MTTDKSPAQPEVEPDDAEAEAKEEAALAEDRRPDLDPWDKPRKPYWWPAEPPLPPLGPRGTWERFKWIK